MHPYRTAPLTNDFLWAPAGTALLLFLTGTALTGPPFAFLMVPVIFFVLGLVVQEMALDDNCASVAGYVGSISKASASIVWQSVV